VGVKYKPYALSHFYIDPRCPGRRSFMYPISKFQFSEKGKKKKKGFCTACVLISAFVIRHIEHSRCKIKGRPDARKHNVVN
jgi:hypothetical protein